MAIRIINRSMDIPIPERTVGYKGDNLVEIRTFELNRFYGDIDLSEFDFKLDTEINGTKNIIDLDKAVTEDKITLTWTIAESHILNPGHMSIQIRAFSAGEEKWHSAQAYVRVQPSINAEQSIPDPLPSEFIQMEQRVTAMKNEAQEAAQEALRQVATTQGMLDEFDTAILPAAIQSVEQAVEEQIGIAKSHADRAQELADTFEQTTLPAAISAVEAAGQAKVDLAEQQAERVEDIIQEAEQDVLPELRQAIEDGIETKDQIDGSIQEAGEAKTALDGSISSAGTAKGELDGSITSAGVAKTQLDGSISSANGIKSQLDGSITAAGQAKELLDESIATGDLANFKAEFQSHKNEYATYKDSNSLKVAKIEKDLNDYKQTMAGVNVNQEATQQATGFGVVSLPKNAANGQFKNVSVFGNTETDGDSTKSTLTPVRLKSVGKNLFDKSKVVIGRVNSNGTLSTYSDVSNIRTSDYIKVTPNTSYVLYNARVNSSHGLAFFDANKQVLSEGVLGTGYSTTRLITTGGNTQYLRCSVHVDNLAIAQLEEGTVATPYEPYTESTQYINAKDENGNIVELRSLPNGTKDEINVTDRKLIKRIGEKSNIANGMVIDFADMAEGGTYYAWNDDGETETGIKGDTLGIDATTLIYQLATPIEIPIQTSGSLVSYPSGTVYIEPFVADAGIYTDKMEVLYSDLPIKALEKISKVDFDTGLETELDITAAVIAEDKLSFTHPDLTSGDIVFFVYEHGAEGTIPETEISYYDSRYVIKGEDDKFYQWEIEAKLVEGVITPSIKLVEV